MLVLSVLLLVVALFVFYKALKSRSEAKALYEEIANEFFKK